MQLGLIKKISKCVILIYLLPSIFLVSASASEFANADDEDTVKMIEPGQEAVDFVVSTLDDEDYKLSDAIGEKVIFLFFWSIFCQPCQEEIPVIKDLYKKVGKDKLAVLAVSLDGDKRVPAIEKFIEKNDLDFTFLMDVFDDDTSGFIASDLYGVMGTPTYFIINKAGVITHNHTGKSTLEELMEQIEDAQEAGS
jgi:peroxiredoxin